MCGIVTLPTTRKNFNLSQFLIPIETSTTIVTIGEIFHLPDSVIRLTLLQIQQYLQEGKAKVLTGVLKNERRYTSDLSLQMEEDLMHLAMSDAARRMINGELKKLSCELTMLHCCGSEVTRLGSDFTTAEIHRADLLKKNPLLKVVKWEEFVEISQYEASSAILVEQALNPSHHSTELLAA